MSTELPWVCFNVSMSCYIYTDYCLVLHLQMKHKYFQQHKWSKAWIDTAKEIVKDKLAKYKVWALTFFIFLWMGFRKLMNWMNT